MTKSHNSASSNKWLARQRRDFYVKNSQRDGYRSRAAYKLIEINNKHKFLTPGSTVIDLGCAPGGWSQVAAHLVQSRDSAPLVIGIDCLEMHSIPGVKFINQDFMSDNALQLIRPHIRNGSVDTMISDMCPPTIGHKSIDHLRIINLCEAVTEFAIDILNPGGSILMKIFTGSEESALIAELNRLFQYVTRIKPKASRKESSEIYVLGKYKKT